MRNPSFATIGVVSVCFLVMRCDHDLSKFSEFNTKLTVSYNPYAAVDWTTWKRCLSQHHDHVMADEARIRAYDRAGYNAIVLLHYAGRKSYSHVERQRFWPLSKFIVSYDDDNAFLATTENLKILVPSMEEVGLHHMTSPFLRQYLELFETEFDRTKMPFQYSSNQELINKIISHDGMAIIAHPNEEFALYEGLIGFSGIEIYNAATRWDFLIGRASEDLNLHFITIWDLLLRFKSSKIWGFAVNDWHGPFATPRLEDTPQLLDSGKTLVMLEDFTIEHYRRSLKNGAFFAIRDFGEKKNRVPRVLRIAVQEEFIQIETDTGTVDWIFHGEIMQRGSRFELVDLPRELNYIRAEISNEYGTVYAQPFTLKIATSRAALERP